MCNKINLVYVPIWKRLPNKFIDYRETVELHGVLKFYVTTAFYIDKNGKEQSIIARTKSEPI